MSATIPTALPTFWEVAAAADWTSIEFISDLHLDESTPKTFDAFASYLKNTTADAVFILGDLFEVWVGDDSRHEGFEARCADLLSDAASRMTLGFMAGNRDFLVGADMLKALQIPAVKTRLEDIGGEVRGSTPEEMKAMVASELSRWVQVVAEAKIPKQ